MSYTYEFPRPSVTADVLVFSIRDGVLQILLIERKIEPFKGRWAIPGGFVHMDEDLQEGAQRELEEETGLSGIALRQLGTYGTPDRDPRGRVITVAFLALVPSDDLVAVGGSDARAAQWFAMDALPDLAFDHAKILADARAQLARDVTNTVHESALIAFDFLPREFTLSQAQKVFETLRGEEMDKRNFRKWLTAEWSIVDTGKKSSGGRHRPAALFEIKAD